VVFGVGLVGILCLVLRLAGVVKVVFYPTLVCFLCIDHWVFRVQLEIADHATVEGMIFGVGLVGIGLLWLDVFGPCVNGRTSLDDVVEDSYWVRDSYMAPRALNCCYFDILAFGMPVGAG
jgi:hypothetical protein